MTDQPVPRCGIRDCTQNHGPGSPVCGHAECSGQRDCKRYLDAAKPGRCPECGHAAHDRLGWCPNLASDNDCACKHSTVADPPGPYIVTELHLGALTADDVAAAKDAGRPHPEATPVGPFATRPNADRWASAYIESWGGSGSWSIAPVHPPRQRPAQEKP